jgi:hypothetical protein
MTCTGTTTTRATPLLGNVPSGGKFSYNFTDYYIEGDSLIPNDNDVALDPYHMCLLYQAHEHFGYQPED